MPSEPAIFESLGRRDRAAQLYEHGLAHDLPEEVHWDTVRRLSFAHKRRGDLTAAVALWREAARSGQIYAYVELAKFYKHRQRDYNEAVQWTQAALALVSAPDCPRDERRWLADLEHRLARLYTKLGGNCDQTIYPSPRCGCFLCLC